MRSIRKIRKSVWQELKTKFEDGSLTGTVYNVYGEDDLRSGTITQRPYVFLLDMGTQFDIAQLPTIIIEVDTQNTVLQLGSDGTFWCEIKLHVFGRDRGERDDIASAIIENVKSIRIYDYSVSSTVVLDTQSLESDNSGNIWYTDQDELPQSLVEEGSLREWINLSSAMWVLRTSSS